MWTPTKQESITQIVNDIQEICFESFGMLDKIGLELRNGPINESKLSSPPQQIATTLTDKLYTLRELARNIRTKTSEISQTI